MSNINIMKNGAYLYKPQQPQPPNEINNQRSTSAKSSSITNLAYSKLLHSHSTDTVAISLSMPLLLLSKSNPTKAFISSFLPHSSKPLFFLFPFSMSHSFTTTNSIIPKARLRGVVFDMDGTLTVPAIDFAAMYKAVLGDHEYRRIKAENPSGIDILHQIENWAPDKQRKAYDIIADYERQGLDRLQIMPGAAELCGLLDLKKIRRGLITRNVKSAVDLFHERFGITFSPALSREFRPYKPDPAPLLHICSAWEVQPNEVIMVGDSLKDDVACGKRAGAFTCLLDQTGRYDSPEYADFDFKPDFKVTSLAEVYSILEGNFDLSR